MDSPSDLLVSVHIGLLLGFIGTTSLLMLLTVVNRLRVREVLMSWPKRGLHGWSLGPALFLTAIVALWVVGLLRDQLPYPVFFTGYVAGGVFWLVADLLKSTLLVTRHGLVLNVNRSEDMVAWGQIVDYFEFKNGRASGLVFFYTDGGAGRRRLELMIPAGHRAEFDEIAGDRLAGRFRLASQEMAGRQALEE